MKLSYRKHWDDDGTVYDQRIRMTHSEYNHLTLAFQAEIASGLKRKAEYIQTSGYETFMEQIPFAVIHGGIVHLNHTQTRFANLFLRLPLKDRNTYIKID